MALQINDFRCEDCGHTFESLEDPAVSAIKQMCGAIARKKFPSPRLDLRMGVNPHGFPTAGDRWAKVHEQELVRHRKMEREHGPDY